MRLFGQFYVDPTRKFHKHNQSYTILLRAEEDLIGRVGSDANPIKDYRTSTKTRQWIQEICNSNTVKKVYFHLIFIFWHHSYGELTHKNKPKILISRLMRFVTLELHWFIKELKIRISLLYQRINGNKRKQKVGHLNQ